MTPLEWMKALNDSTLITDDDRRVTERSACGEIRPVRLLVKPSFRAMPAFIRNFCQRGVGLIIMKPLDSGVKLAMQLRERQAGVSGILTAQVCHVTTLNQKYWFIGCQLSRGLSDAESEALVHGYQREYEFFHELDR
jgi:hypothetical protein